MRQLLQNAKEPRSRTLQNLKEVLCLGQHLDHILLWTERNIRLDHLELLASDSPPMMVDVESSGKDSPG
jgi:hypothetical protein